jgi:lipoxygenase
MHDEEFARQVLAGINPVAIERVREFPIRSAITAKHIEPFLEGLDVQTAVAEHKLFVLDYHDIFLPFVNKINESPTSKAYATRTLLFTRKDGTLIPIAIELSLPPCEGNDQSTVKRVFTPQLTGTAMSWTWALAKTHVLANDAGYHQLVSHW